MRKWQTVSSKMSLARYITSWIITKIIVDEKEYVVPMMVEEPSVVAAASYGSKLVNQTGGFKTIKSERLMIGQIVFDDVKDTEDLTQRFKTRKPN